jgi:hypothetical protein
VELLHLRKHRFRLLEPFLVHVEAVPHGAPHRIVPALDPNIVREELPPHRGRAVEQHLQPLRKVADNGIERHEKILDLPVYQLILRRVDDDRRVENSLAAGLQRRV